MRSGDIFRWHNFPYPRYNKEDIKPRWFIYLGDTGKLSSPIHSYILTATTTLTLIEPGEIKHGHTVCRYHPNNSPFDQECIVDIDEGVYSVVANTLENNSDIEVRGSLTDQQMRELYNRLIRSRYYSKKELRDIHRSFNDVGITSLRRP